MAIARVGRAAETDFVGAPVGIMDQMASSLADDRTALFLDARTLAYERVPLPAGCALAVVDSGISHDHATGDYRTRRAECEMAAALLGVRELRDVGLDRMHDIAKLPAPLDRRARHVVTENRRVLDAVDRDAQWRPALASGALFTASHASMRDDFEVERSGGRPPRGAGAVPGRGLRGAPDGGRVRRSGRGLVREGSAREVADRIVSEAKAGARVLLPEAP